MNISKKVSEKISSVLQKELVAVTTKLGRNSYTISTLAEEQKVLKKERVKLQRLIAEIEGRPETVDCSSCIAICIKQGYIGKHCSKAKFSGIVGR